MPSRRSLLVVGWLVAGGVIAQAAPPRPAGETARAWAPAEAHAMAFASWLANAFTSGAGSKLPVPLRTVPGYRTQLAGCGSDGVWRLEGEKGGPAGRSSDVLHYLVPDGTQPGAKRIVCVRMDGAIAFTDNAEGTACREGRELAADSALAGGTFPRTPAIGGDRNLWLPADQAPRATMRVTVVGDDGKALGTLGVATVAAGPEHAIDALLPAAFARTLREGDATLQGVPARGLGFAVDVEGTVVLLPAAAVRLDGSTARLTVPTRTLQQGRARTNEAAVIATLKNISSAQSQCQACGAIDANKNGAGEYGTFAELTGRDAVRGKKISPPVLSTAFQKVENGVVTRSGYCFRMVLPGVGGAPVPELATGGPDATAIDAGQAETLWCCYAWPLEAGATGQRCFFINQAGDVLACENADGRYSGAKGPGHDAAFAAGSDGKLMAAVAANMAARDGRTWTVVP